MNANRPADRREIVNALRELGFTELEGEIYLYLSENPPATGYRVARGVGRTNANTYKALQSLEAKGAVLVEESEPRLCRAVPPTELLGQMRRRFDRSRERAEDLLRRVERQEGDERIYHLTTRDQVLERGRRMLARARHIAAGNLFPTLVEPLREALIQAAERGVWVLAKVYAPVDLPGVEVIERLPGGQITGRWPREVLNLNVDGREHLLASLYPGGDPEQAVWTSNAFVSFRFYYSAIYEQILTDLQQRIRAGAENSELVERLDHYSGLHPVSSGNEIFRDYLESMEREQNTESRREGG